MNKTVFDGCPPTSELSDHPLLNDDQALSLEKTFKMLANSTRLRILHVLAKEQEICVSDLAKALDMNATAVSNQLQRMTDWGVLTSKREGLRIFYRIIDPCVISVVNYAWCLTQCAEIREDENNLQVDTEANSQLLIQKLVS